MSSFINRNRPKLVIGGIVGCAAIGVLQVLPYLTFPGEMSTPGTRNIEKRFSAGGAAKNFTPATGTKLGDPDVVEPKGKSTMYRDEGKWKDKVEDQALEQRHSG